MNNPIRERACLLFAALAHPTRLRIVEILGTGEKTVNEIASDLHVSQSGTSQHLAVLVRAGILAVKPQGVARLYRIRGPRIARILDLMVEFCEVHNLSGGVEDEVEEEREGPLIGASEAPMP